MFRLHHARAMRPTGNPTVYFIHFEKENSMTASLARRIRFAEQFVLAYSDPWSNPDHKRRPHTLPGGPLKPPLAAIR